MTAPSGTGSDFESVASLLSGGKRFLLTGHRNPDGDSLGSALALALALRAAGKGAVVVMRDRWSSSYAALPGVDGVLVRETLPDDWPAGYDAAVVMECPEAARPGFDQLVPSGAGPQGRTVNIDHHPGNARWGTVNLVDLPAAAVGETVADLLDRLGWPLTRDVAVNLWVALVSDTGSFRYSNTTPKALALGARLVAAGVSPGEVNEFLFEARPLAALRLETLVLATLGLHDGGSVATVELPLRFLAESGADAADSENLVNRARGVEGVRAAALLRESDVPGEVRCSLRSKGNVDVRSVAGAWGGGGHRNASGCRIPGTIDSVRPVLVARLTESVRASGAPLPGAGSAP